MVIQATALGLSQREACDLMGVARSTVRYEPRPDQDAPLAAKLAKIRGKYAHFGIRRAHALLRAEGQNINRKRVERVWRRSGLQVPQRPKKRRIKTGRGVPCQAEHPDHVWSYDFQEDGLLSGRKLCILSVLDEFTFNSSTREWLSVTVGVSQTSQAVLTAPKLLFAVRGVPRFVRSDNGPEFIAAEVRGWLQESGSSPHYIDLGCPWQNGFQESFHGKLRDEPLDRKGFASVPEAPLRSQAYLR